MDNNSEGRVIKFRAWNVRTKVMQYTNAHQTVWCGGAQPSVNTTIASSIGAQISGDFIPMQFTGLFDKNGREIYEGDIVKVTNAECVGHDDDGNEMFEDAIGQVYFESGSFVYNGHTVGEIPIEYQIEETEVIGNIYENPELLKTMNSEGIKSAEQKPDFDNVFWQLCPKCQGQGIVSRPPWIAPEIANWPSSQSHYQCDVCNGNKIIESPNVLPLKSRIAELEDELKKK